MKISKILIFLSLITLSSCNKVRTTSEDKKSVEEVQKFYGGYVETNKGIETFNASSNNYFEIIIKDSKLIDKQPQRAISNAANIAYIVFKNQNIENYDIIKTKIILPDGTNISKSFTKTELQEVKDIYPELEKFNSYLINKNYKGIIDMFDSRFKPEDKIVYEGLSTIDSKLGEIKRIQFQGFEFIDDSNLGHTILIRQVAERNETFPFINVVFNRNTKKLLNIEFP
ncbi:hypothetical protein ACLB9Y_06130 [Chryseobacterium scophthalmum]|uniref:hypothetical protein n=1 Tax=Chryseobacterium scophthalmum TaxID=59733 RepID=UPI00398ABC12